MNLEAISQITFSESFLVPATQTADRVLAGLPFGAPCAPRLAAVLCTAYLVAHLESLCINEMQRYVEAPDVLILGAELSLRHRSPARAGDRIAARGCVVGIGDREATFNVEARIGERLVAEGSLRFVAIRRALFFRRLMASVTGRTAEHAQTAAAPC